MGIFKNIVKYGLFIATLGLASPLNLGDAYTPKPRKGSLVSKVNPRDIYVQKAIKKLPISEVNMVQKIDADLDNDDDYIVVGKLFDNHRDYNGKFVGKDKCGIFFLENENNKFKAHTLEDRLDRYPEVLNSWVGTVKGQNINVSIDNLIKKRKKLVLTLETEGKKYKAYLNKKKKRDK